MAEIAEAANVTRQTVYRLFSSRTLLIEELLSDRVVEIGQQVVNFSLGRELEDAIVEGVARSIHAAENDQLIMAFFNDGLEHEIELFWGKQGTEQFRFMLSLWAPVIVEASVAGRLRAGVSETEFVEWIIIVSRMLVVRDDFDDQRRRAILRKFLVPALLNDTPDKRVA